MVRFLSKSFEETCESIRILTDQKQSYGERQIDSLLASAWVAQRSTRERVIQVVLAKVWVGYYSSFVAALLLRFSINITSSFYICQNLFFLDLLLAEFSTYSRNFLLTICASERLIDA